LDHGYDLVGGGGGILHPVQVAEFPYYCRFKLELGSQGRGYRSATSGRDMAKLVNHGNYMLLCPLKSSSTGLSPKMDRISVIGSPWKICLKNYASGIHSNSINRTTFYCQRGNAKINLE
jgi:hypothetical protein